MILTCPNCATKFRVKPDAIGPKGRKVKCRNCGHTWHAMPEDDETQGAARTAAAPAAPSKPKPAPEPVAAEPPPPPPPEPDPVEDPVPPPPPPEPEPDYQPDPVIDTAPEPSMTDGLDAGAPPEGMEPPPIPPEEDFVITPRTPKVEKKSPVMAWAILVVLIVAIVGGGIFFQRDITANYPPMAKVYGWFGIEPQVVGYGLEIPQPDQPTIDGLRLMVTGTIVSTLDERAEIPLLRGELKDTDGQVLHSWTFRADKPDILPGETVRYATEVNDLRPGVVSMDIRFEAEMPGGSMDADQPSTDEPAAE